MTFKEKLQMEHPECVNEGFGGGCECCPDDYGYEKKSHCVWNDLNMTDCTKCWNREMPSEEPSEPIYEIGYNTGLVDAWSVAKDIYSLNDRKPIFGKHEFMEDIFDNFTPQEAIELMKAYVEQSKIEVGDVVLIYGEEAVVTRIVDGHANILFGDGVTNNMPVKEIVGDKTGKHIDISSILEQIGE